MIKLGERGDKYLNSNIFTAISNNKICKSRLTILLLFSIGLIIIFSYSAGSVSAASGNISYVSSSGNDNYDGLLATWNGTSGPKATITNATGTVGTNGTIYIAQGTYDENNITINEDLNIIGENQQNTVIDAQELGDIFTIATGVNVTLTNLTLINGNSTPSGGAILNNGTLTINNCILENNYAGEWGGSVYNNGVTDLTNDIIQNNTSEYGGGIFNANTGSLTVNNSTFQFNHVPGEGGAIFSNGGSLIMNNSTLQNNSVICNGGECGDGGAIAGGHMTITSCSLLNNTSYEGGAICDYMGSSNVSFDRIVGNTATIGSAIYNMFSSGMDANNNWWGSNNNPSNDVAGFNITSWMILNITTNSSAISNNSNATITADLTHDNNGINHDPNNGHVPDGIPITFSATNGSISTTTPSIINGQATAIFTAASSDKPNISANIIATINNQTVKTSMTVNIHPAVTFIDPTCNAITNNVSKVILVTFNEPITAGPSYNNIKLSGPSGTVPTTKNINGTVLTITATKNYVNGNYYINIPLYSVTDIQGNNLTATVQSNFTIDTVAPKASANLPTGYYNTNKVLYLSMNKQGTIYYTTNGTTPTTTSRKYGGHFIITNTTVVKYLAVDLAGNKSPVYSQKYTIDKIPPIVSATSPSNGNMTVSLTAPIIIKFSENIVAGTNFSKIYVKNLTTSKIVPITKKISGDILTIKQSVNRINKDTYQVVIPSSALMDLANNNNKLYTFKFKTGPSTSVYSGYGVRFNYPLNWNVQAFNQYGIDTILVIPNNVNPSDNDAPLFEISINPNAGMTNQETIDSFENMQNPSGTSVISRNTIKIDDTTAYEQVMIIDNPTIFNEPMEDHEILILKNNNSYILDIQSPEKTFAQEKTNFNTMLDSLKIN